MNFSAPFLCACLCLATAAAAQLPYPQFTSTSSEVRHCDSRFKFCVTCPAALLPEQKPAENSSSIFLSTADLTAQATAEVVADAGASPTPQDIFAATVRELSASGEAPLAVSSLFGDDFYECFFLHGGKSWFHKAFLFDGYFVRLVVAAPLNRPELMTRLREDVELEFDGVRE